jgi:methylmalonyl-CoA mutase cobalamin-binding domain/chain
MLLAARAMKMCLAVLHPLLADGDHAARGKVVIGTVKGDIHDIGKNIVAIMLEGSGFEVVDLGVDVSAQAFAEAVVEHRPDIVGLSALLTTTMPEMRTVISTLEELGVRDTVKVMVGGAALTDKYAREIGADAYAPDAALAGERAKKLVAAPTAPPARDHA